MQAAAAALRGETLVAFDNAALGGPTPEAALRTGARTAPDIQPDLSMHVPVAKARTVRRTVIERRIQANEWHGAEIETPDMAQEAQREAQREKTAARSQAQRQREERRQSVLQRIQEDEAPLMPRRPLPPHGGRQRRDSSIMMRASADERRLATQVARLLGRTNRYVSPGGVVNLAQRTTTARLLHLLRFHGIRKDGTRFSAEELRTRSEAMRLGSLPSAQLPYRTADELRVAPSVLKSLPRSSAAALISAGVSATAARGSRRPRDTRTRDGQAPLPASPSGTSSAYLEQGSTARGRQSLGEESKMAVRRARLERRKRRRRVAAMARQAALASAGSAATARLPPTTTLLLHLRQEEEDDGDMDVLSEGGISSGDSDDSAVVRAIAAPALEARRHQPAFGLMPGAANLRAAIARSQARLARTRTGASATGHDAPRSPSTPVGRSRDAGSALHGSNPPPQRGGSPLQRQPLLADAGDSSALRAWASLERQLEVGAEEEAGAAGGLAVSAGPQQPRPRVPRLQLGATGGAASPTVRFRASAAGSAESLADASFAFSDSGPSEIGRNPMSAESSPRGGASPRSQAGEPGVLDNGTGLADDEAVRRSFRDGFVPEWLRRAVEEARSLPDLLQLEADAWSFGEHSASAAVAPADSTLRFAFKVFRPMFDGGIGAAALAGSRGIAAALAGAGGGPGTNRRGADSKGAAATAGNDASASGGVAPGADVAGDLDEQTIEDELVDADLSGRNAAHALAARGMPTREPSPEPYLPLTDRRPVRAPARVPTLEHELQLLSAKEAASLRIAEAQAALEQGRSAKLDLQAHVDTDGVDATPRMLSSGQLVRTPLQAAAAADQARQWRLDARAPQPASKAGLGRDRVAGASASRRSSGGNVDTHGAFIEVQGKFFSIPQAVMDEAALALLKREGDGAAPAPPARDTPGELAQAAGDGKATGAGAAVPSSASVGSRSSARATPALNPSPAAGRAHQIAADILPARPSRPKSGSVASSASAATSGRWSVKRGAGSESKESAGGGRGRLPASARPPRPGARLVSPDEQHAASLPRTARPAVDTSPVRAAAAPLGSLAQSTKASWSGWRRAPVRPVVERALRSKASGSRRGRSKGSADLAHFAPELAGKSLKDLGAGDLFELARLEGDRKLARLIESVETSRGQAQLLRASAVERQLSCASIANLTEEAMPLIRADAEIARTVQAELQASGTAWFTDLLRTLAGMQTRKDVLPVQLLLLAQAREEFQRGRQPGPASLRSVLLRITRDEFASPVAQLLFAFFRRVARIPLEQWRELATESGMPRPAEVFIADAMKARASAGHSASAHSRYTRVRK